MLVSSYSLSPKLGCEWRCESCEPKGHGAGANSIGKTIMSPNAIQECLCQLNHHHTQPKRCYRSGLSAQENALNWGSFLSRLMLWIRKQLTRSGTDAALST